MSRLLKRNRQALDYALWQSISNKAALVSKQQANYLADRDRGTSSSDSDFFRKEGRNRYGSNDTTKVYDFISLSSVFDNWFDRVRLDREGLLTQIQDRIQDIRGSQVYFDGVETEWLDIEWGTLGRVIGAAVANIGRNEVDGWKTQGRDARISNNFWSEILPDDDSWMRGISEQKWDDKARFFRERRFDPNSEILRAFSHRPSSPFWQAIDEYGRLKYHPNPLVLLHRSRLKRLYGSKDPETEGTLEYGKQHGQLMMEMIELAMNQLKIGNCADFAIRIHGLCAAHVMRSVVTQQKIGLHLISNLAIRRKTRAVGALNVPDIAYHLDTGFRLAKVLEILQKSRLIDWYTIEKEIVDEALSEIL